MEGPSGHKQGPAGLWFLGTAQVEPAWGETPAVAHHVDPKGSVTKVGSILLFHQTLNLGRIPQFPCQPVERTGSASTLRQRQRKARSNNE